MARSAKDASNETRWAASIAVIGLGGSSLALPDDMVPGPRWLVPIVILLLLVPAIVAHRRGNHRADMVLGYGISVIVTLALAASLASLMRHVGSRDAHELLRSASILWITNILVFALWYWRLDAGGPHVREARGEHTAGAFFFPQMMDSAPNVDAHWSPRFVDYLFVSFCTSTAFSPTDTPVLSRWAKLLTMVQALISLLCVAVLASKAIGSL
jgi:hypothetical protein